MILNITKGYTKPAIIEQVEAKSVGYIMEDIKVFTYKFNDRYIVADYKTGMTLSNNKYTKPRACIKEEESYLLTKVNGDKYLFLSHLTNAYDRYLQDNHNYINN
jgi:hypothetical protein